ncbi:response regulator transcription factor [Flavobacterium sp. ACAM 123]|uniref:response regulator transcription factor n=1 Tax=Flavobacterium sp. ACAM 123 TaxID=1189620 RepID=UPI000313AF1D|nr:response regulator transcription factor [Flavobacterium sp. ACAM 123]
MVIKDRLVLVEDDLSLGSTMVAILNMSGFEVIWKKSGHEAVTYLKNHSCDFILCDLMMPFMNGEQLLSIVREDKKHNITPFIIITANLDTKIKQSLLKNGVNDYITKPFNTKELIYKINNMLAFKQKIIKTTKPDPFSKVTIKLSEKDFTMSLNEILSKNLQSQINTEQLAKLLFKSKSTLDKQIRHYTNRNTSQYMREFKLEYAIKLINLGEKSIHFLIKETGFNSSSYFTTSFKDYTGMTPRNYIKQMDIKY